MERRVKVRDTDATQAQDGERAARDDDSGGGERAGRLARRREGCGYRTAGLGLGQGALEHGGREAFRALLSSWQRPHWAHADVTHENRQR